MENYSFGLISHMLYNTLFLIISSSSPLGSVFLISKYKTKNKSRTKSLPLQLFRLMVRNLQEVKMSLRFHKFALVPEKFASVAFLGPLASMGGITALINLPIWQNTTKQTNKKKIWSQIRQHFFITNVMLNKSAFFFLTLKCFFFLPTCQWLCFSWLMIECPIFSSALCILKTSQHICQTQTN